MHGAQQHVIERMHGTQRLVVLYRCRVYQCGLHMVLWSHIDILMHLLAAEPHSTAEFLFPSQCLYGIILMILCSDDEGLMGFRSSAMPFYWPSLSLHLRRR